MRHVSRDLVEAGAVYVVSALGAAVVVALLLVHAPQQRAQPAHHIAAAHALARDRVVLHPAFKQTLHTH